jgi:plasmid maintenance system antidote protein VapI
MTLFWRKRAISADTAVRLAKFFGTTESFWLGMQADYDAHQTKKYLQKELGKIKRLGHVEAGRHFGRDEMNER